MEMLVIAVLAIAALMLTKFNKAPARRLKRARVRSNSESSYRQTNVRDDRC
jgi:peptidoglycan/LPS O-acetylase OafA/YrhL